MKHHRPAFIAVAGSLLAAFTALAGLTTSGAALAHDFTAAILVVGEDREARLAAAVKGFLIAAGERDGHANETADGHLGGVDVFVVPLPAEAATGIDELEGAPDGPPDFVVVVGPDALAAKSLNAMRPDSTGLRPGVLPPDAAWRSDAGEGSFARRYRAAYGAAPDTAAAEGYNAARRLDLAIRPHDEVTPRAAIAAALAASEAGIEW